MNNVKVRNNVNVLGDPKAPSVVLAHGFGCDQTMWRFLVPDLVKTHQVILFDYTGSGQSTITDFSTKKYSRLEGYAQDIVDIIDFLSIKDVVVIGHSVSAIIAALASIKVPDVISKIVMVCPSPCFVNDLPSYEGGFERQDLENLLTLMDKNRVDWANYLAPLVLGESNSEALSDELLGSFYKLEPLVAKTFAKATFLSDYRQILPKINAKTLILQSSSDKLVTEDVIKYMHQHITNSKLVVVDAVGHCLHMTHSEMIIRPILNFLQIDSHSSNNTNIEVLNNYCSGHFVVGKNKQFLAVNKYMNRLFDADSASLVGQPISKYLSHAANFYVNTHIYPLLAVKGEIEEAHLSWLNHNAEEIPVVVNINLAADGISYWSLFKSTNHHRLYSELVETKEQLVIQNKSLHILASTDFLTGLLNRRELLRQATIIDSQMRRSASSFAVLALDIDFFKKVNDTHGHQVGDKVLKHVASQLMQGRRTNDLVARVGGEEFVLILPDVDEKGAFIIAENIRERVASQAVDSISVTVSIGVVVSKPSKRTDIDGLLLMSDNGLLESKRGGRNKTVVVNAPLI